MVWNYVTSSSPVLRCGVFSKITKTCSVLQGWCTIGIVVFQVEWWNKMYLECHSRLEFSVKMIIIIRRRLSGTKKAPYTVIQVLLHYQHINKIKPFDSSNSPKCFEWQTNVLDICYRFLTNTALISKPYVIAIEAFFCFRTGEKST